jgi:hypothetical protein
MRQADRPALEWIETNLPDNETVLINPFLWGYGIYAGQDGGYWITPLAGRKTLPPPNLYSMGNPQDIENISRSCQLVLDKGKDPAALHELMRLQGVRYIYSGRRGGVLSPKALQESTLFNLVYAQDGVWIFEAR